MGLPDDSVELLRRASAGDSAATHTLLDRYRERVLQRVRLLMGPRARSVAESGDFVQGVLVEVLEGFECGRSPSDERSFLRWLTAIARNNIRDSLRRDREHALEVFSSTWIGTPRDRTAGPASRAELTESVHRLLECLERLDADHRLVIELKALEGLPVREVALRLGRSEGAVHMLYKRGILRLGKLLGAA